jgi:hypothetical protein
MERAHEIFDLCARYGIEYIVGIEPDKPEDVSDVERAVAARQPPPPAKPRIGRNEPCSCGSGLKYKKCCQLKAGSTASQSGKT